MLKLSLPIAAILMLSACDSDDSVRITRSIEVDSNRDTAKALKVISNLQCPSDQGVLTRVGSASVDGQSCTYTGPRGAEIKLHLVALTNRTSDEALKEFQQQLAPDDTTPTATVTVDSHVSNDVEVAEIRAPGVNVKAEGDDATISMPGVKIESKGDQANVSLPGMSIQADGDRARIKIAGLVINADDQGSTFKTSDGSTEIHATEAGATVRTRTQSAVRATMIHSVAKPAPNSWRVVGYEARGPSSGPLVIATFRTRDRDEQVILESVRELVVLNVGD